jgi:hypothetical protein
MYLRHTIRAAQLGQKRGRRASNHPSVAKQQQHAAVPAGNRAEAEATS